MHLPAYLQALGPAPKRFYGGTHRLIAPEETLERVRRLMPVMGITRIANVTGLDRIGMPVVVVCRPNARSLSVSQGKGLDLAAAKASGLMESVEMYHAEHITLPLKFATYNDLRFTHRMVNVSQLPSFSVSAFHLDLRLLWIEGIDLLQDAPVWLPYEMVYMDYTLPLPPGSGSFAMSSNGLASGNHPLEALSHAICEVVERDAGALWHWLGEAGQRQTRIDPGTIDDPVCLALLARFEEADVLYSIWDMTSDIGVATFRCVIVDRKPHRQLYANTGTGCHPSRQIALLRALTEAAQSRLTMIASSRDDVTRSNYELARRPEVLERVRAQCLETTAGQSFSGVPHREHATFAEDVVWLLERLQTVGVNCVATVDLSKPGLNIPVMRVVIPGLEPLHNTPGYVPGPRARRLITAA